MSASLPGEAEEIGGDGGGAHVPADGPGRVVAAAGSSDHVHAVALPGIGDGPRQVVLSNGRRATAVMVASGSDPRRIVADLGLRPDRPVLVLLGGADSLSGGDRAQQVEALGRAIVEAAGSAGAVVVDGATDSGLVSAVGAAMADAGHRFTAVGVAPAGRVMLAAGPSSSPEGRVALEPNHSHFVLVDAADWGEETELLVNVVGALAPVSPLAVVVGGGDVTDDEARMAVRLGWRVLAVEGTGGTAARLASEQPAPPAPGGPEASGSGRVLRVDGARPEELVRLLAWELHDGAALDLAWERFARWDTLAVQLRKRFEGQQRAILLLGIAATLLALLQHALRSQLTGSLAWMQTVLRWSVVAVPIVISAMVGWTARTHTGKRWVLLRGAAEAAKREIYRYRTQTGDYAPSSANEPGRRPETVLVDRIGAVDELLMKTEVSSAAVPAYEGPTPPPGATGDDDDGESRLDPDRYLDLRVREQRSFYRKKTVKLERTLRALQLLTVAAGALGTFLAAAGFELWVGLTTVVIGAAAAHLGQLQIEGTLVAYNQAITKLDDVEAQAVLAKDSGMTRESFEHIVDQAEAAIHGEHGGWTQQMHESLDHPPAAGSDRQTDVRGPIG